MLEHGLLSNDLCPNLALIEALLKWAVALFSKLCQDRGVASISWPRGLRWGNFVFLITMIILAWFVTRRQDLLKVNSMALCLIETVISIVVIIGPIKLVEPVAFLLLPSLTFSFRRHLWLWVRIHQLRLFLFGHFSALQTKHEWCLLSCFGQWESSLSLYWWSLVTRDRMILNHWEAALLVSNGC